MPAVQPLSKAPIIESAMDIRIKPIALSRLQRDVAQKFLDELDAPYSVVGAMRDVALSLSLQGDAPTAASDLREIGFFVQSHDQKHIAQFRVDGFAFSRLQPYVGWESFFSAARQLWQVYARLAMPEDVGRLGVRTLNRITMPFSARFNLSDYFSITLGAPTVLSKNITSFLARLTLLYDSEKGIEVSVAVGNEPALNPRQLSFILDTDVFIQRAFEPRSETMWDAFAHLRHVKNLVFFECITDKTVSLLK